MPVSYTHLDVYKRQGHLAGFLFVHDGLGVEALDLACQLALELAGDVYKRQGLHRKTGIQPSAARAFAIPMMSRPPTPLPRRASTVSPQAMYA